MRGRRHTLTLIGQRAKSGVTAGQVARDAEGRWRAPAGGVEGSPSRVTVKGFIGPVKATEVPVGVTADSAAQVPEDTPFAKGDDLIAADTGSPHLDGRYEVTGFQAGGRADILRLFLRRYDPQEEVL